MSVNVQHAMLTVLAMSLSALFSTAVSAMPDDINQPIRVEADSAVRDESRGQTIYSGDVKISQGSLIISAESIVMLEQDSELNSIVAKGQPATLSQQLNIEGERVYASAQNIEYNVDTATVQLLDNAQLSQGGSKISSQQITYNVRDQIINAQSGGTGSRVEMVIPAKVINEQVDQTQQENP
ncbi:MAG TPA: lipopolysaccharide transport periplasmic protein LptA [Pseudomonadales bacterium]|nr:lipopolysaccharide transport periplasmic protein LptA [Pseudomonadales bacterium]